MINILAQTDIIQAFGSFYAQAGAVGAILLIGLLITLTILWVWRKYQNAKIDRENDRQKAETQRIEEYNAQTALINEFAKKATEAERAGNEKLFTMQRELGKAEGQITEISNQMRYDREKYEGKQKELEGKIDELAKQSLDSKNEIDALKNELTGKNKEIGNLIIERDIAIDKLAEKEAQLARINANLDSTTNEVGRLNGVVQEQSEQIKVLSYELAALLPLPPPEKPPTLDDTIELKPEDLAEDPLRTLDNPSTQPLPIDIEDKKDEAA